MTRMRVTKRETELNKLTSHPSGRHLVGLGSVDAGRFHELMVSSGLKRNNQCLCMLCPLRFECEMTRQKPQQCDKPIEIKRAQKAFLTAMSARYR